MSQQLLVCLRHARSGPIPVRLLLLLLLQGEGGRVLPGFRRRLWVGVGLPANRNRPWVSKARGWGQNKAFVAGTEKLCIEARAKAPSCGQKLAAMHIGP